jgi:hypothetical protein
MKKLEGKELEEYQDKLDNLGHYPGSPKKGVRTGPRSHEGSKPLDTRKGAGYAANFKSKARRELVLKKREEAK